VQSTFARISCLTVVAFGAVLSACGGDDGSEPAFPREDADVVVTAVDIGFEESEYEAQAGDVGVFYVNDGATTHTLLIEDVDGFKLEVQSGGDEDAGTVNLEAGDYTVYCDIPGHRAEGMEAPLTIS
jgi:plastocyanin